MLRMASLEVMGGRSIFTVRAHQQEAEEIGGCDESTGSFRFQKLEVVWILELMSWKCDRPGHEWPR